MNGGGAKSGEVETGDGARAVSAGLVVRCMGRTQYEPVWNAMRAFTTARDATSRDELWLTEHEAVFTQGQAGKDEHVLLPGEIAVVLAEFRCIAVRRSSEQSV